METKTGICPNPKLSNLWWHVGKAGLQQFDAALPGTGISGTQFGIPQIGGVGFDAQQWIVRALAAVAGIVADLGAILVAKDGDDSTVEIEDQTRAVMGPMQEVLQQAIINTM